ncbi:MULTISPECIES: LysR family transcriptional regulator [unclassified Neptuniibacter]|jgi:DNA-binding transcriptional LysR family regulator|uniref:LysR family transcriptional regulator n=1 Tax=unclassified Neptuniibacter TaxID=2630693 RepID=UPI0026E3675E|nr:MULTISPECIES: LysR family transcriptional regulator [unclassified Neptuniibacter]MDO6513648.1 LysR family transcriptional regulator [Neptuniibacter sp. 2_MG-2023]MDO6593789.1 LysR family transcriptional regulator [Neptuniibacter sp. 1_MG-2023]
MLLEDLQVVLKVAEFKSITAAATNLDMRTATASAALKRVETSLGVELFVRTTRHLRISSAGEKYLPLCEQAMLMLDQARQNVKGDLDIIDGELRIAIPSDLGRNLLNPLLDQFMETHSDLSIRINISDSNIDFYRDSVDMAFRYGSPEDSNLYGFKICNVPGLLCATEEYLENNGTPQHPHDLVSHNGLFYQLHDVIHNVWTFRDDQNNYKIKMSGNRASNDGDLVRRWCVAGKGLAVKSCLDMSNDLLNDRVVNVMPNFKPRSSELWLVCPTRQSITPAVRLLRDHVKLECTKVLQLLIDKGVLDKSVLN